MHAMTLTLIGTVATPGGYVEHVDLVGDTKYSRTRAMSYQRQQKADLALHFDHDETWRIGTCCALIRSRAAGLVAVARIDSDIESMLDDGPWYFSDGITSERSGTFGERSNVSIDELSLTRTPAIRGLSPVRWAHGEIGSASAPGRMPLDWYDIWQQAADTVSAARYRKAPDHLTIHDTDELTIPELISTDPVAGRRALADATAAAAPPAPAAAPVMVRADVLGGRVYRHRVGGSLHLA
jgi:hypothetical protein